MKRLGWLGAGLAVAAALAVVGAGEASAKGTPCGKAGACAPRIESVAASDVGEHTVTLEASIQAVAGATYEVWIGYAPCQGGAGECPKPPQKEDVGRGKVMAGRQARTVIKQLKMLTPGCTYTYWFVATHEETVESDHEDFTAAGGTPGPKECRR